MLFLDRFCLDARQMFLDAVFDEFGHERVGNGFVQWQLKCTLGGAIRRNLFLKFFVPRRYRIQRDVFFVRGKTEHVAVLNKRWDAVLYRLLRVGRGVTNRRANFLYNFLDV